MFENDKEIDFSNIDRAQWENINNFLEVTFELESNQIVDIEAYKTEADLENDKSEKYILLKVTDFAHTIGKKQKISHFDGYKNNTISVMFDTFDKSRFDEFFEVNGV
jgi:hypothetical protein